MGIVTQCYEKTTFNISIISYTMQFLIFLYTTIKKFTVSFLLFRFGCNVYEEDCAYSTEHGMRHLMHVITVGCIDIDENM